MNEKNLALFIYEVLILLYGDDLYIDDNLLENINNFIYQYYKEYKEEFRLLFNIELLEKFLEKNYEILPMKVVIYLLQKYMGDEKYAKLVESVDRKTGDKINDLAIAFILYLQILQELNNRKPDGPYRILQ